MEGREAGQKGNGAKKLMRALSSVWDLFKRSLCFLMIFLIRFYQLVLSPLHGPCCRYIPSCSAYAREAIELHGPFQGLYLAIRRILRCNPFSAGGYDPVPQKFHF